MTRFFQILTLSLTVASAARADFFSGPDPAQLDYSQMIAFNDALEGEWTKIREETLHVEDRDIQNHKPPQVTLKEKVDVFMNHIKAGPNACPYDKWDQIRANYTRYLPVWESPKGQAMWKFLLGRTREITSMMAAGVQQGQTIDAQKLLNLDVTLGINSLRSRPDLNPPLTNADLYGFARQNLSMMESVLDPRCTPDFMRRLVGNGAKPETVASFAMMVGTLLTVQQTTAPPGTPPVPELLPPAPIPGTVGVR